MKFIIVYYIKNIIVFLFLSTYILVIVKLFADANKIADLHWIRLDKSSQLTDKDKLYLLVYKIKTNKLYN